MHVEWLMVSAVSSMLIIITRIEISSVQCPSRSFFFHHVLHTLVISLEMSHPGCHNNYTFLAVYICNKSYHQDDRGHTQHQCYRQTNDETYGVCAVDLKCSICIIIIHKFMEQNLRDNKSLWSCLLLGPMISKVHSLSI